MSAQQLYVANSAGIQIIDLSRNELTTTARSRVNDLVVSLDGARIFATGPSYQVQVIDVVTHRILDTIAVPLADGPGRIRLAPDGKTVYLAYNGGAYVIDVRTLQASAISLDATIDDIAIAGDGGLAYFLHHSSTRILVFNASRHEIVDIIDLDPGGSFTTVMLSRDDSHLYVAENSGRIVVVDTSNRMVVDTIPVDPAPEEMLVSPDGALAYVAHRNPSRENGRNRISVIDLAERTVVAHIALDHAPGRIALAADGTRLYVAHPDACSVSLVDTVERAVMLTIPLDAGPYALAIGARPATSQVASAIPPAVRPPAPAGSARVCAYVSDSDDQVSVIDTEAQSLVATVKAIEQPTRLAVHPDGTHVYVASVTNPGGALAVIDTATNTVSGYFITGTRPFPVRVSGDGLTAYVGPFDSPCYSLMGINTMTGIVSRRIPCDSNCALTPSSPRIGDMAIAPDQDRAYIQRHAGSGSGGSLTAIDLASGSTLLVVPFVQTPSRLALSPDGQTAYATLRGEGIATLAVIDTVSGDVTPIELGSDDGSANAIATAIRPDGGAVYVGHSKLNNTINHIAVVDTATHAVTADIAIEATAQGLAFTPDGAFAYVTVGSSVVIIDTVTAAIVKTIPLEGYGQDIAIGTVPFGCSARPPQTCTGDCKATGVVAVQDLVTGVNIALGRLAITQCQALDTDHDEQVSIDELVQAVANALNGCPPLSARPE